MTAHGIRRAGKITLSPAGRLDCPETLDFGAKYSVTPLRHR
jgi:hypothetical protein